MLARVEDTRDPVRLSEECCIHHGETETGAEPVDEDIYITSKEA